MINLTAKKYIGLGKTAVCTSVNICRLSMYVQRLAAVCRGHYQMVCLKPLQLNSVKTEFIWFGTTSSLMKI